MLPEIAHRREFSEGERLPAREALFEPVPEGDPVLAEVPAEEDEFPGLGVLGGEVHEATVEVLHLDTCLLELGDDETDLAGHVLDGTLSLLHMLGIEAATVPTDLAPDRREPLAVGKELLARRDEPTDQRSDHGEGRIRFPLAEEAHTC